MKRLIALILFFAVFALINGPPVYSMTDVDGSISIETIDSYMLSDIESEMIFQHTCILPGGLELKYPTTNTELYVVISRELWLYSNLNDYTLSTEEIAKLNDLRPDANTLALNTDIMGLSRLDIGESYMDRHIRKTYI